MKKTLFILLLFTANFVQSQILNNSRTHNIFINSDTTKIDSLSVIPNSINIFINKSPIDISLYKIDYAKGLLITGKTLRNKNITIYYNVFQQNFTKRHFHKDFNTINYANKNLNRPYIANKNRAILNDIFNKNVLKKRGNISRGISFGNNQDAIVNSNLNLQLSGKISDNLYIEAAITDNNIPIQPDGNTQQIQDFDKVFIKIYNDNLSLTVGDFEIQKPKGYFLNVNKKVEGAMYSQTVNKKDKFNFTSTVSGAISKGEYNKMIFKGVEGKQGPYKLKGANNELYVIVLSGTEKVYIDGELQTRGEDNDYVIDYNTSEITFTTNKLISKDKRISVEYEYSDKNYARFMLFNSNEFKSKNSSIYVNIYSESDSKNQSFDQELSDSDKKILANIGDNINNAIVPNIDSIEFDSNIILYKLIDSTSSDNIYFDSIYVYSTNPDSAFYRLGFSDVGGNNGNYQRSNSSANGRVYKWVAPVNGIPQGNYEPVVLLITPKKKQLINIGTKTILWNKTELSCELSISNKDINTFSKLNSNDNIGYGLNLGLKQKIFSNKDKKTNLSSSTSYQLITENFNPIERFREVEFERDWNLIKSEKKTNTQIFNTNVEFLKSNIIKSVYNFDLLQTHNGLKGTKHIVSGKFTKNGFETNIEASYLNTTDSINSTQFFRTKSIISKRFKYFTTGVKNQYENNQWNSIETNNLLANSFSFNQYEVFINNNDTSKNFVFANYKYREDFSPFENMLINKSKSEDWIIGLNLLKNPKNSLKSSFTYRNLSTKDTNNYAQKKENTIIGKFEYNFNIKKGFITSSTLYELSSGLELKKEYIYIEVDKGLGLYIWKDYNNDKIKTFNEYEKTDYTDQANYIRMTIPSNTYVKTFSNQFNQLLFIRPAKLWQNAKGIKKFISRFTNQFTYRVNHKDTRNDVLTTANPFQRFTDIEQDTSLIKIGANIKNTISFNRKSSKFGIDYIIQENKNKFMLINGFDSRSNFKNGLRIKWNITNTLTIINNSDIGEKNYTSQEFSDKNFTIPYYNTESNLSFQPNMNFRISLIYIHSDKKNTIGKEKAIENNLGTEIKYSVLSKGNLSLTVNFIKFDFIGETNSPIAYEMLNGLQKGNNTTWGLTFQKSIGKALQLNINYSGRASEDTDIVHIAGVQLRAYF